MPYVQLLRPGQWTKNLFLLAGLVFGQKLTDGQAVVEVLLGLVCFCLVSSAVYVLNDLHDRNEDRLHPRKRLRPIASGRVSVGAAWLLAAVLLVLGLGGGFGLNHGFFAIMLAYLALQTAYTLRLKQVVLLDVIIIGIGFVLRAIAGAVLAQVVISHWLVLCTFTLCLFMGFSKRRCELDVLAADDNGASAASHRKTLAAYTPDLLNHMTTLTAGIAVVSFVLYSTDARTLDVFGTNYLLYTLPLVVYAIFRFALLVEHGRVDGPTAVVLHDRPFQAAIVLWVAAALVVVYWGRDVSQWVAKLSEPLSQ